jgi:hypothetical protein
MPLPKFSITEVFKPGRLNSNCIVANGYCYHRIDDLNAFYVALGYTIEMNRSGLLPEEFIWETYLRNGAPGREQCIQCRVMAYLHAYSEKFRNEYGNQYTSLLDQLKSDIPTQMAMCDECVAVHG